MSYGQEAARAGGASKEERDASRVFHAAPEFQITGHDSAKYSAAFFGPTRFTNKFNPTLGLTDPVFSEIKPGVWRIEL